MRTRVGYAGGTKDQPTYHDLGDHTEAIEIVYDPDVVGYEQLLLVFWDSHRPYQPPWSRQYRSAIFPANAEQHAIAEQSMAARAALVGEEIHTAIEDGARFWRAEDYHQKYQLRGEPELMAALAERYPDGGWVDSTAAARLNGLIGGHPLEDGLKGLGLDGEAKDRARELVERAGRPADPRERFRAGR